jgi:hypothetical protein
MNEYTLYNADIGEGITIKAKNYKEALERALNYLGYELGEN